MAIVDTGVMVDPDLNVVGRVDCVSSASCETGGFDGYGHGSHVAGIIGAADNGSGVLGVAPAPACTPSRCWTTPAAVRPRA